MSTLLGWVAAAGVLIAVLPTGALAQRLMRVIHRGRYVLGEVLAVEKVTYGQGRHHGVQLLLGTAKGTLAVHLGPSWFVDHQRMRVAPHDVIEVTGSRVTFEGKPALIANVIRKGNERLRLRTPDGAPLWPASRMS